jgi:hypothetical protein
VTVPTVRGSATLILILKSVWISSKGGLTCDKTLFEHAFDNVVHVGRRLLEGGQQAGGGTHRTRLNHSRDQA